MPNQPNLNDLMKQAQKMQQQLIDAQTAAAETTVEGVAGGGAVRITATGSLEFRDVKIDPAAVDPDDVEMLQDLIVAAVNEGLRMAQELQAKGFGGITQALGGMGGGLGNLLG